MAVRAAAWGRNKKASCKGYCTVVVPLDCPAHVFIHSFEAEAVPHGMQADVLHAQHCKLARCSGEKKVLLRLALVVVLAGQDRAHSIALGGRVQPDRGSTDAD